MGYDQTVDQEGIDCNKAHAAEILPFLKGVRVKRTWAGLMPFSIDGNPLIGALPEYENLFIVSGLASSGFGRGQEHGDECENDRAVAECESRQVHSGSLSASTIVIAWPSET